ncbi:MAG: HYR domain-containing protein [Lewinellaceae bacterium]|nr:HYR domain-containing protein [Lewinellaceae bacterium]
MFLAIATVLFTVFGQNASLSAQTLNDNGSTNTINVDNCCVGENYEVSQGNAQDYTIPADASQNAISFTLRGGDGGFAKAGADCKRWGGDGATVKAVFLIGNEAGQLEPGGKIRFVVGKHGEDIDRGGTASGGSGGGGGTGLLYQPNNSNDWIVLAVAGGGGGAHQGNIFGGCIDSQNGQGGRASENGGNGEGEDSGSGGTGGNGGNSGPAGNFNDSGAGGGAYTAGSGGSISGDAGYSSGGYGGDLDPNSSYDLLGRGGFGFGGGGRGGAAAPGGGGGGYSGGGGGGKADNGGGGGSYVNGAFAYIQDKADGGNNSETDHGYATYQFLNICTPEVDWIEEVDGFCGTLLGGAHLQVHLTNASNCTGNIVYQLYNALINISNTTGQFSLLAPGTYFLAVRVELNGYNSIVDTETITVTQGDTRPPVARCRNYTVSLSTPSRLITNFENLLDNGSTDNCGIASYAVSSSFFDCSDLGANNITLTVTDGAGNSSTCVSVVTVVDTGAPVPDVTNLPTITEECSATITTTPTATDNCEGTIMGTTSDPLSYTEQGTYTVTWAYVDSKGNTRTQNQTVILNDASAPTVSCPGNITVNAGSGACSAEVNFMATASDNCDTQPDAVSYLAYRQNVPAGNDRLLIVQVTHFETVTGITYNGMAMTKILDQDANVAGTLDLWYLPLGSGGEINASAVVSGVGSNKRVEHLSFENVDQDNPIGDIDQARHQNSVQVNTRAQDMIYEGFMRKDGGLTLPQSGQTLIFDKTFNSNSTTSWGSYKAGNGSIQNLSINSSNGAHAAVVIQAKYQTDIAYSVDPGSEFQLGTTPVTFTATDHANNSSSCTFNVSVQNTTPPTITCPANITVNNDANECGAVVNYSVLSSDNCSSTTLEQTAGLASNTSFPIGTTTNTFVATNDAGITSTCSFTVTVNDNTAPVANCQDLALALDDNGEATLTAAEVDNGSSDNCSFTVAIDQTEFSCAQLGANTVTLTATDEYGNTHSCVSTVTVVDNIAPTAICQGDEPKADQSQLISDQNQGFTSVMGQSFTVGIDGNLSKIRFLFSTIINNSNITIAPIIEVRAGEGLNGDLLSVAPIPVSSTENTPMQWIEVVFPAPAYVNAGSMYTIVLRSNAAGQDQITFSDLSLNIRRGLDNPYSDGQLINSFGNTDPWADMVFETFVGQSVLTVQLDANGHAPLLASDIGQDSYDNCSDNLSFELSATNFSCADVGAPIAVTMTVTDGSGNSASCSTTVTVVDGIAPTAICQDKTVQLNADGVGAVTTEDVDNGSSDACGIASLSLSTTSFDCTDVGMHEETLTVMDVNGNIATCTANITVVENSTIYYADLDGDGYGDPAVFAMGCFVPDGYITDNTDCNDNDSSINPGATEVCDGIDNDCDGLVDNDDPSLVDNIPPTINCPLTQALALGADCSASLPDYTSLATTADNCGVQSLSQSPSVGTTAAGTGNMTVTLNVTDVNGNSNSCQFTVSKADNTAPTISCPLTQALALGPDCAASLPDYTGLATTSDNCGVQSLSQSPSVGTIATSTGNIMVTLNVTDVNGNSNSCQFTVSKADNTAPTINCPATQALALGPDCAASLPDYTGLATTADNCGVQSLSQSPSAGTAATGAGNMTVTLGVTDGNGNSNSCQFTVSKADNTAPTINCPLTQALVLGPDCAASLPDYTGLATTSDNCGVQSLSQSPSVGTTAAGTGNMTVTLGVTDGNGNSNSCQFTVSKADNTAPTISCPLTQALVLGPDCSASLPDYSGLATTSDNCGVQSLSQSPSVGTTATGAGNMTVTLGVTDVNGNSNSCQFTVNKADNTAPVAVCRNTTVYLGENGQYSLLETDVLDFASSYDNCSFSVGLISPAVVDCADFGTTVPVMVSITDPSNNFASCLSDVYVDKSYGLPAPWAGVDIGYAGAGNSYVYDPCLAPPAFTITANANNSTLPTDNLGLISQELCGDFQVTARIQSVTPTGFAGLTARESSAPGSRMVGVYTNLNSMVRWETRTVPNGNKLVNFFPRPLPYWLRLQRQGNWFLSYSSYDGLNFTLVTAQQVPAGSCLEVGMGAFTNITGQPATAVFSNLSLSGGVLPLVQLPASVVEPSAMERNLSLYPNPARDVVSLTRTSNPGQPGQALPVGEGLVSYSNQKIGGTGAPVGEALVPYSNRKIGGTGAPVGEALISYSNQKIGGTGAPVGRTEVRVQLYNELGQVLQSRQWPAGELRMEWPVQELAPGVYFFEVMEQGQAPQVLKFVRQE